MGGLYEIDFGETGFEAYDLFNWYSNSVYILNDGRENFSRNVSLKMILYRPVS
jgi:hypothetical protein